jgi:hypothetical protein
LFSARILDQFLFYFFSFFFLFFSLPVKSFYTYTPNFAIKPLKAQLTWEQPISGLGALEPWHFRDRSEIPGQLGTGVILSSQLNSKYPFQIRHTFLIPYYRILNRTQIEKSKSKSKSKIRIGDGSVFSPVGRMRYTKEVMDQEYLVYYTS